MLPSETAVIALGVATAGSTDPRIALLVGCAAAGAFIGDNLCYLLGRRFGPAVQRRFFSHAEGRAGARVGGAVARPVRHAAHRRLPVHPRRPHRGDPHLRAHRLPAPRFVPATAVAAVIWALYAFFIGRLGGQAFEDNPWAGLVIAFGASIAISGVIELIRRGIPALAGAHGVTPDRLSPTTPARIRAIETSLIVETASPRKIMPTDAAPAAPIPVHTA